MQMTFRWYGEGNDRISLQDIKQIPGVKGIVWALHDKMPGEVWQESEIEKLQTESIPLNDPERIEEEYNDVVEEFLTKNKENKFDMIAYDEVHKSKDPGS